jgi:hypothetical protein
VIGSLGGLGGLGDLLVGDPLRATLAAAPGIVLLFALLARRARARGAEPLPAGWARFALGALAALALAALARGPLGLDDATPAIAAGLMGLAAVHAALQTRALRPLLGSRMPARPSVLFFLLPALLYEIELAIARQCDRNWRGDGRCHRSFRCRILCACQPWKHCWNTSSQTSREERTSRNHFLLTFYRNLLVQSGS